MCQKTLATHLTVFNEEEQLCTVDPNVVILSVPFTVPNLKRRHFGDTWFLHNSDIFKG